LKKTSLKDNFFPENEMKGESSQKRKRQMNANECGTITDRDINRQRRKGMKESTKLH
jgi:hypothetical protein